VPSKGSSKSTNNGPMPSFRGNLKQMDEKTITVELEDHRVMQFRRNSKTKFFRNGDEIKSPKFDLGDQLSIEGPEDAEGYFTAVNVYWERSVKSADTETAGGDKRGENVPDAWKDDSKKDDAKKDASPPAAAPAPQSAAATPPPPDPDDPGPPVLTRGRAADAEREHAADNPTTPTPPPNYTPAAAPPDNLGAANTTGTPSILRGDEAPVVRRPVGDPLIAKAVEAALDFTEELPNYVCQEMMARYQSETRPANWQAIDVLSAALVYDKGKEDYRDIAVNGKPTKKSIDQVGGSWSTGEFGTILIELFAPATAAQFHYRREERQGGVMAKVYDYSVRRENSNWRIVMASQTYMPAYKGSIWIDPATARVLRIEMQAVGFPEDFPTDDVESAVDYQYTRLGDSKQYLLPVHAETLSCQRGSDFCSHNVIDFRNYHKYSGESTITFNDIKK